MSPQSIIHQAKSLAVILLCIVLAAVILYAGKTLFIPLGFAMLISFILYPLCRWFEKKGLNRILAISIPLSLIVLASFGLGYLLVALLVEVSHDLGSMKPKLIEGMQELNLFLAENLGLSVARQSELLHNMVNNAGNSLVNVSGGTVSSISEGIFFMIMVPIFSFLILLYRSKLLNTLYHLFPAGYRSSIYAILADTIQAYYNFVKGMALVYLVVGILNSIGLTLIGVPHPVLFGFIASVLTFIPYVGIMIAALLPITMAWVTFDSIWYSIAVIGWFTFVQALEAYLIFPYIVGKRLKVNTLVMFIMIILGGMLWGAAGMILFIPLLSIIKLISARSPKLKFISELLGE